VTTKPDGSPVTDVDVAIETALRASLARDRPGDMVTGEELGDTGPAARRWYLDPIDGTKRFIAGDPAWMTLIALAVDDRLVLGIVDFPALGERWWAVRGRGAFHDGRRLRVSTRARLADATSATPGVAIWRPATGRIRSTRSPSAAPRPDPTAATASWRSPAGKPRSRSASAASHGTTPRSSCSSRRRAAASPTSTEATGSTRTPPLRPTGHCTRRCWSCCATRAEPPQRFFRNDGMSMSSSEISSELRWRSSIVTSRSRRSRRVTSRALEGFERP